MKDRGTNITSTVAQLSALATVARGMIGVGVEERDRIRDFLQAELEALASRMYEAGPGEEVELRTFTGSVASLCLLALDSDQEHTVCSFPFPAWTLLSEAARRWAALPLEVATGEASMGDVTREVVLNRMVHQVDGETVYRIGRDYVDAEGQDVELLAGPVGRTWWEVPLPACPDCGGVLAWAEAGLVPGARECSGCGSRFMVVTRDAAGGGP